MLLCSDTAKSCAWTPQHYELWLHTDWMIGYIRERWTLTQTAPMQSWTLPAIDL